MQETGASNAIGDLRWEGKEINYAIGNEFPEIVFAFHALLSAASRQRGIFLYVDQAKLDALIDEGTKKSLIGQAAGARIDRLCLYYRLMCGLGPGGDHHSQLGALHYWNGPKSESVYGIVHVSPANDWVSVMVVNGEPPC